MQTVYYCVQGASSICKCFLEYKKIQELSKLNNELERQKHVTEALTSYSKLIRNDVKELMHMFFKSAFENLNYALNSDGESRNNYILAAKSRFIDAIAVENNENLILSYLGLALCQIAHGEADNCIMTLDRIKTVYCELPDDGDELFSMLKFNQKCQYLFGKMYFKAIMSHMGSYRKVDFTEIFEESYQDVFRVEIEHDMLDFGHKEYLWRLMTAYKSHGLFSPVDVQQVLDSTQMAIKQILQEDFDAFKTEVINNIQLYEQI